MDEELRFPPIPKDIIDALNERFPERSASLGEKIEEIMFKAGQRDVIRFLNAQFDEQNKTILTNRIT
jgi:hypothetical protein